jgi:hypothetical protein
MNHFFMTNTVILLEFNGKLNGSNSQEKHILSKRSTLNESETN